MAPVLLRKGMVYSKEFLSAFSARPRKKKKTAKSNIKFA